MRPDDRAELLRLIAGAIYRHAEGTTERQATWPPFKAKYGDRTFRAH